MKRSHTLAWAAAAGSALALSVTFAATAGTPAEDRRTVMKDVGFAMRDGVAYVSGQSPWDAAKAGALMKRVAGHAKKLATLYPASSASDPKTEAAPNIWKNKPDFEKRLAEMGTLATAAGNAKTLDAYKPAFQKVSGTCKSCHDVYRKKKA
jgi:cytochrome c556